MNSMLKIMIVKSLRRIVVSIENSFGVRISRYPLEKFYAEFIELANLDIISQSRGILHIGAHVGLESKAYSQKKADNFRRSRPKDLSCFGKKHRTLQGSTSF
jgi:hypothetical protein